MSTNIPDLETINLQSGIDIAIPLTFDERQPVFFRAEKASSVNYELDGFLGNTLLGSSCNVATLSVTPHCNGTHTECAGHITTDPINMSSIPVVLFSPARLVTVDGTTAITRSNISSLLDQEMRLQSLIIRTLPNSPTKKYRNYDREPATWFDPDAISYIVRSGIKHLVVDIPSIDPADSSLLPGHHAFWNVQNGALTEDAGRYRTITELAFVPESIEDGLYAFCNSWPLYDSDAAPSRPMLFRYNDRT